MEIGMIEVNPENRFKCPITGELFDNPVKKWKIVLVLISSKSCGHTYSKEGIMNYLRKKKSAACPVAGCGKMVTVDSLIPDEDMVWKMV